MSEVFWEAMATFFVTVGPLNNGLIFSSMTRGHKGRAIVRIALKSVLVSTAILFSFALFGDHILALLGIRLFSLQIAGGILLLVISIAMVTAHKQEEEEKLISQGGLSDDVAFYPLAVPFIAGPDAIVSVVMLVAASGKNTLGEVYVLAALGIMLLLTFVALIFAGALARLFGKKGSDVVTRVLGVLLCALAVEFILNGLAGVGVFPGAGG